MIPITPKVRDFMATALVVVPPDMDIHVAMSLLVSNHLSGVPVVSQPDVTPWTLVGLLSERDCLSLVTNAAFHGRIDGDVSDYMNRKILTIDPDKDLFSVSEIFMKYPYRVLPVIDAEGFLVGTVSRRDVLNAAQACWGALRDGPPESHYVSDEIKARLANTSTF